MAPSWLQIPGLPSPVALRGGLPLCDVSARLRPDAHPLVVSVRVFARVSVQVLEDCLVEAGVERTHAKCATADSPAPTEIALGAFFQSS